MTRSNLLFVFIITILSVFTFLPLFHSGFFNFHDNTQVVRVFEMGKALTDRNFPVRWVMDLGYGYGYPIFNFYAPFPYYLGGILIEAGLSALMATKIMFVIGIALSGISMFFFARKFFGTTGALVAGVIYAYFPYHAVNIYVRGAVGEFFAYAFLPLLFLGMYKLAFSNNSKFQFVKSFPSYLLAIFGLFLVAVSHNLTLFMVLLLFIPLFAFCLYLSKTKSSYIIAIVIVVLFGLSLSAFYIVPAFSEMKYTNVISQVGGGADFKDHFVCISQYWDSPWGFGGSTKGCVDGLSFKLGKLNILLMAASLLALGYSLYKKKLRKQEKVSLISVVLLVVSVFLTLPISEFVWKSIPYMPYIQYPWRFINFIGLFLSFLIGYLVFSIEERYQQKTAILLGIVIIVLTITMGRVMFTPQNYNAYPSSYYTDKSYIGFTASKISDEYMPPSFSTPENAQQVPHESVILLKTPGTINILKNSTGYLKFSYNLIKDGVFHVNTAYFPGWKAFNNGKSIPIVPTHDGMNISVGKGSGVLELRFDQTVIEIFGDVLTLITIFIMLIVIIRGTYIIKNER